MAYTLIEDFASGAVDLTVNPGHTLDSGVETGTMLGGTRFNYLLVLGNPSGTTGVASFNPAIPALTVTPGSLMTVETFVRYGSSGEPDLNVNLTGEDRLRLSLRNNSLDLNIIALMGTKDAQGQLHTVQYTRSVSPSSSAENLDFLFSGFSSNASFQLSDVDQISFQFNNTASGAFSFDRFAAVPEPASAFYIGIVLVGLRRARRLPKTV